MAVRPETRSRTRMCAAARRRPPCYRHPEESITGICASCLRERLSGLDVSVAAGAELRRCKSVVSPAKCGGYPGNLYEPRRKSCDVLSSRGSLCQLSGSEDLRNGSESEPRVDWRKAGVSRVSYNVIDPKTKRQDRVKGFDERGQVSNTGRGGEDEEEGSKTMREFIDLEINKKNSISKDLKGMAGNLLGAASIASKKLLKWKKKNKDMRKPDDNIEGNKASEESRNRRFFHYRQKLRESHSPIVGGRRSCDTRAEFSPGADGNSLEQPRASWDGYRIARTIPRLAPMLSLVDNGILGNVSRFEKHGLPMEGTRHFTAEEKSSSGASGSSYSNSDSSSSMRWSSFDRSTSVRSSGKKVMGCEDCAASPANVKLVITEKELKDWNLNNSLDKSLEKVKKASNNNAATDGEYNSGTSMKKPVPWRRICETLGFRTKNSEGFAGIGCDHSMNDHTSNIHMSEASENVQGINSWRIGSMSSFDCIEPARGRRSVDGVCVCALKGEQDCGFKRNNSAKYSSVYLDTSFYATPHRSRGFSSEYRNSRDYIVGSSFLLN